MSGTSRTTGRATRGGYRVARRQRCFQRKKRTIELLIDNLKRGTIIKLTSFRSVSQTQNHYTNNKHRIMAGNIWSDYYKHIYNILDYLEIEYTKRSIPKLYLFHELELREFKTENREYNLNINITQTHPLNLIYSKIIKDIHTFYTKLSINNHNKYWRFLEPNSSFNSFLNKLQNDGLEIVKFTLIDPENSIPMNTTLHLLKQLNTEFHLKVDTAIKLLEDHQEKGHIACIKKNIFKFVNIFPYNCNICKLFMALHIDIIINNVWSKLRSLYHVSAGFAVDNEIVLLLPKKYENLIANILEIEAESLLQIGKQLKFETPTKPIVIQHKILRLNQNFIFDNTLFLCYNKLIYSYGLKTINRKTISISQVADRTHHIFAQLITECPTSSPYSQTSDIDNIRMKMEKLLSTSTP